MYTVFDPVTVVFYRLMCGMIFFTFYFKQNHFVYDKNRLLFARSELAVWILPKFNICLNYLIARTSEFFQFVVKFLLRVFQLAQIPWISIFQFRSIDTNINYQSWSFRLRPPASFL